MTQQLQDKSYQVSDQPTGTQQNMHSSRHHASYTCPVELTFAILLRHDVIVHSAGHARSLFWAQPVVGLPRFVCHSFAAVFVIRMTFNHNGLCAGQ